jgi:phosphate uptake regulator
VLSGCVHNQVGSARNAGIYASKAARSAESALSAVSTVQMVADAASDGKVFGSFASVAIDQQEDAITEIAQLFRSIQPPDDESVELRDELGTMLDAARDHIAAVRIAVRRGDLDQAADVAAPLSDDADQLEAFSEAHK